MTDEKKISSEDTAKDIKKDSKSKKDYGLAILLGIFAVLAAVGFLYSHGGLKEETVAQAVDTFRAAMKERLAHRGYEGDFSYDGIAIEGSVFSSEAVLSHPKIAMKPLVDHPLGWMMGYTMEAPQVTLRPDAEDFSAFSLVVPQQVTLGVMGNELALEMDAPLTIGVVQEGAQARYSAHDLPAMHFKGDADIMFSKAASSEVSGTVDKETGNYEYSKRFSGLEVTIDGLAFAIGEAKSSISSMPEEGGIRQQVQVSIEDAKLKDRLDALGPIALNIGAIVERDTDGARVDLDEASIRAGDFTMRLSGIMESTGAQILPSWHANLSISEPRLMLDTLTKAEVISPFSEQLASLVLDKASPGWKESGDEVNIALAQTEDGAILIGETSFKELAASVLANLFAGQAIRLERVPAEPVAEPAAGNPAAKPEPADAASEEEEEDEPLHLDQAF